MGVVSNNCFDRDLLSILYIFKPWCWPMFRPPFSGPPEFHLKPCSHSETCMSGACNLVSNPASTSHRYAIADFERQAWCPAQTAHTSHMSVFQEESLVSHYLSNAGFLQKWQTIWQHMVNLDTINSAYNKRCSIRPSSVRQVVPPMYRKAPFAVLGFIRSAAGQLPGLRNSCTI